MLTIILQLQDDNAESLKGSINSLKNQTIGFDKLQVVILDSVKNKSEELLAILNKLIKEKNITITTELDITRVNGEYISFLNTNYVLNKKSFENLYNHIQGKDLDFVSAVEKNFTKITIKDGNALSSNYFALTGLKLIKKDVLLSQSFNIMRVTDNINIQYIHLVLFLLDFKYSVAKECVYRHNISFNEKYIKKSMFEIDSILGLLIKDSMRLKEEGNFLLISHIMFMIDKNTFLDNIDDQTQRNLYNNLGNMLDKVDYNKFSNYNLDGYMPFFNLILKGLYEEATHYMKLLRSKRYWYTEADRLEKYFIKNPSDLIDSLSWKVTEPLRQCNNLLFKGYNLFYKYLIILLAVLVKISYFNKQIWLVGEREDQAEDNGYYFFKYCRERYQNEKIFYIINKSSPQLDKVDILGNVIYHSSFKHRIYMLAAHAYINAWVFEECSYPKPKENFINLFKGEISKKVNISIQHGVIIQNISPYLSKEQYKLNLILASSIREKKIIKQTLGYTDDEISITGLARFDYLHEVKAKNQILIMPTWRRSLSNISKNEFQKSTYFKTYKNLLENENFHKLIEDNNIQVKFYIHNQMQKYIDCFVNEHPNIEFLDKSNSIVSDLLKESALLITDYSSVSLDFLYMNKPVLLYQFDPENNHHVPSEEIKYSNIGLIISNENELINKTEEIVTKNFKTEDEMLRNAKNIFKYRDNKNCERIFKAIHQKASGVKGV